jgi:hypothetical protein
MRAPKPFENIAKSFTENIHAIRALSERIGGHADEHDRTTRNAFVKNTLEALGVKEFVQKAIATGKSKEELFSWIENTGAVEDFVRGAFAEPAIIARLDRLYREYRRVPPIQGALLRRGALTTLVAFFESLLADLIQAYYSRYPAALPQDAHTLTLIELKSLGSVEEAEHAILEREAETVLRSAFEDQLKYFSKRLKLDLSALVSLEPSLTEILQRRNILVHNDGIVNRIYFSRVPADLVRQLDVKEGTTLRVTQEYISGAVSTVWRAGSIILQQAWRKWETAEAVAADSYLIDHSYDLLLSRLNEDVVHLAQYASTIKMASERAHRVVLINACTALRRLGGEEEVATFIATRDWSACSLDFQLALAALQDDVRAAVELLPKAVATGDIAEANIREWPLFERLRDNEEFTNVVVQLFGGSPDSENDGSLPR